MKPDIGISVEDMAYEVQLLSRLLANEYVVYTKTRNYHWNVEGPAFNELHVFFQHQYEELDGIVDQVAERCRTIGSYAIDTLVELREQATISERPGVYPDAAEMIGDLLTVHEAISRSLRLDAETAQAVCKDAGTSDTLVGLIERHEKTAWMLRSFRAE
jgi:starvation-inducible DNA-binding protein